MPANSLRRALRAYRRDEARARVARFRGLPDAESDADVLHHHRWLTSDEALERLAEAEDEGAMAPDEALAMRAHVADVHAARALARTRAAWAALPFQVLDRGGHRERCIDLVEEVAAPGAKANRSLRTAGVGALERAAAEVAPRVEDAAQRAHAARVSVLGTPSPGLAESKDPKPNLATLARSFLALTDDLAGEALSRAASTSGSDHPERWEDLAALLAFPNLQGRFGPRDRARRVAAPWAGVGFARELQGVKLEAPHATVGVRARLAVLDPTRDVRVSVSTRELGLASELALLEGVGRALGQLLLPAALPFVQALPVEDEGARTLAALMLQLPCDPVFLGTGRTLAKEVPQIAAAGVCLQLVALRVAAAALLPSEDRSRDAIEGLAARALGVPVPLPLARLTLLGHVSPRARFRAGTHALLFWTLLRDAHDEDWFRNPRSADTLRAMLALSTTPAGLQLPGIWERSLSPDDLPQVVSRLRELLES
ncbi:MAG: hypothetical protein IPN77_28955 [Sandaracinaceae bacterium]|nr:hypothetical protein [Sandaracinaceae bacterium]